ncbi:MAG: dihydroorotate dehydrogenase [Candidatus Gastranaerophilales bacterium]|nr:dihydroorotate dehydrogenase [Candidatus Gastranaerophilales bacterium]
MAVDLSINLNDLKLKNPIITASGTFGYADEYNDFINVQSLGAIVTKAISLEPRKGNKGNRIMEVTAGMINSIGLENMGIKAFINNVLPILKGKNIDFIMNIAGATKEEYIELSKICENNKIKAIEMNLSCPNVKAGCLEFGTNEETLYSLVKEVRENYNGILITKLTPNVSNIEELAVASQKAGADIISAINTVKATGIKLDFINGKFYEKRINGGLSGRAIKPVALRAISAIRKEVDIPIIGMGGISSLIDILEFVAAGADAFQIGTANFTHPTIAEDLVNELEEFISTNNFKSFEELKNRIREDIKNE